MSKQLISRLLKSFILARDEEGAICLKKALMIYPGLPLNL
jgi:hypothetical protein